jgi:hypothetical protein
MKAHNMDTVKHPDACPPLTVRSFGLIDPGKVRDTNEDQFLIAVLVQRQAQRQASACAWWPFLHVTTLMP